MDFVWTTVRQELTRLWRRSTFYPKRLVLPAAAGLIVLAGTFHGVPRRISTMGLQVFMALSYLSVAVACLVPCCSASPVLVRGRYSRVLELLLVAHVSPGHLVLGCVTSSMFASVMSILSVLPAVILCVGLGGVSTVQILQTFMILCATVFLGTCLGIFVSLLAPNARRSFTWAALASLLLFAALPLAINMSAQQWLGAGWQAVIADTVLPNVSPVLALRLLFQARLSYWGLGYHLFALLFGAAFLGLTVLLFPARAMAHASRGTSKTARRRAATRRVLTDNPMLLREGPASMTWRWLLFGASLVASLVANSYLLIVNAAPAEVILWVCAALFGVPVLLRCCRIMVGEAHGRTFEILCLADLSPGEIILGKLWAGVKGYLPWFAGLCAALACVAVRRDAFRWAGNFLCIYLVSLVTYCIVALALALRCNAAVALTAAVLSVVGWAVLIPQVAAYTMRGGETAALLFLELCHLAVAYAVLRWLMKRLSAIGRAGVSSRSLDEAVNPRQTPSSG